MAIENLSEAEAVQVYDFLMSTSLITAHHLLDWSSPCDPNTSPCRDYDHRGDVYGYGESGDSLLRLACDHHYLALCDTILKHTGAEGLALLRRPDPTFGITPLYSAASRGNLLVCEWLKRQGAMDEATATANGLRTPPTAMLSAIRELAGGDISEHRKIHGAGYVCVSLFFF